MNQPLVKQGQQKRPGGVAVIAILSIVVGLVSITTSLLGEMKQGTIYIAPYIAQTMLEETLILGIVMLALGWGLWMLKPWAFWVTVTLQAVTILNYLLARLNYSVSFVALVFGILIPAVIIVYLFADNTVRSAFRV
jgi:hypothetical protein